MKLKHSYAVVYILVQVRGSSFIDMLRYDSCCPASEIESRRLSQCFEDHEPRWIIFKMFCLGKPIPTIGRWDSFGCKCHEQVFYGIHQANVARDRVDTPTSSVPLASFISTAR